MDRFRIIHCYVARHIAQDANTACVDFQIMVEPSLQLLTTRAHLTVLSGDDTRACACCVLERGSFCGPMIVVLVQTVSPVPSSILAYNEAHTRRGVGDQWSVVASS